MTTSDHADSFSGRLRDLLRDRADTAANLARSVECSPQAVGKWLKGGDIGFGMLRRVADYFGVNWVWLRYGQEALDSLQEERRSAPDTLGMLRLEYMNAVIANDQRHQKIFAALDIGVFEESVLTGESYWSACMRSLMGAPAELQASHENFRTLIVPEDKPAVDSAYKSALLGTEKRAVFHFHAVANPTEMLRATTLIERDGNGHPLKLLGILQKYNNLGEEA